MPPARLVLYVASAAVVLMTLRTLLVGPLPLAWAIAALVVYVALVLCAVLILRWRVFVDAVVRGPPSARGVVLTFDDGPHPRWTPRVLELLRERGAPATFFLVAHKAQSYPEVVRSILSGGHAVALHSHAHDRLFALRSERRVREDLERGIAALEQLTGKRPSLFRPPIGHTNPIIARVASSLDLTTVGWTISGHDGTASARPEHVVARVRRDLRDGAIVLLHDSPEQGDREPASIRALSAILDAIDSAKLDVVPLESWVPAPAQGRAAAGSTT